jgi:hypothetical protein
METIASIIKEVERREIKWIATRCLLLVIFICLSSFQSSINKTDKNGLKQGKFVKRYANGGVFEVLHYLNDTLHGKFISYYPNGNTQVEKAFSHGKEIDTVKIHLENGILSQMFIYKDSFQEWLLVDSNMTILQTNRTYYSKPYKRD